MMLKPSPFFPITLLGPEDAEHRVYVQALTHGIELAPRLSLDWAKEEFTKNPPKNVQIALVAADPAGYFEEGYGFADLDGHECVDPPTYGNDPWGAPYLTTWTDLNSEFGFTRPLSKRSADIRRLLDEFQPTVIHACHESWSPMFWGGAGLLLIEAYPTAPTDWNLFPGAVTGREALIGGLLNPVRYLSEIIADWARGLFRIPTFRRLEKSLSTNPHYQFVNRVVERYEKLGGPLMGMPWQDYVSARHKNEMVGPGRLNTSLATGLTDWLTLTSYGVNRWGAVGLTSETFDPIRAGTWGLEERGQMSFLLLKAIVEELDGQSAQI